MQYERLSRSVKKCENAYDLIDLMDLSNTLRIWCDLKLPLMSSIPSLKGGIAFKTATPSRKATKSIRNFKSVLASLPESVLSRAETGEVMGMSIEGLGYGESRSQGGKFKLNDDSSVEMRSFWIVDAPISEYDSESLKNLRVKRGDLIQWLGSEIVRVANLDDNGMIQTTKLTREQLVRRMANAFGGSHPSLGNDEYQHVNDLVIRSLFRHSILGLPLPYYLMLGVAQRLLKGLHPHLSLERTTTC